MSFQGTQYTEMPEEKKIKRHCVICNNIFTASSGPHKFCSVQCKTKNNQLNGSMTCKKQYERISGDWTRYFNRLNRRTGKRPLLTTQDMIEVLEKQKGLCALSGVPLTCLLEQGKKFKTNASVDRIIAGGEYVKDNIQLVCAALNSWRADTDLQEFIWFCKQVTKFQEERGV